MDIEIREHIPGEDVENFIRAGHEIFKHDPAWVAPLDFEFRECLSPRKNPLFERADEVGCLIEGFEHPPSLMMAIQLRIANRCDPHALALEGETT